MVHACCRCLCVTSRAALKSMSSGKKATRVCRQRAEVQKKAEAPVSPVFAAALRPTPTVWPICTDLGDNSARDVHALALAARNAAQ